jgi:hypothetical protein
VHLFNVKPAVAFDYRVFTNNEFLAEKRFITPNPDPGVTISYYMKTAGDAKLEILDKSGAVVRELTAKKDQGMNRVQWDLRGKNLSQTQRRPPAPENPIQTPPPNQGAMVDPGEYTARLTVGAKEYKTSITVEPDPETTVSDADRAPRRTLITTLYTLQSKTDPAAARADSLATQLNALDRNLEKEKKLSSLTDALKDSAKLRTELTRINRSVNQAFGAVSGSPFAPTATQREETEDLQKEFETNSVALDKLLKETVPRIEKELDAAGISRITVR